MPLEGGQLDSGLSNDYINFARLEHNKTRIADKNAAWRLKKARIETTTMATPGLSVRRRDEEVSSIQDEYSSEESG